jgi:biotin carboxyl carrier protein
MSIRDILYSAVMSSSGLNQELEITRDDLQQADIQSIDDQSVHIILNHKSYLVKIIHSDFQQKEFILRINGKDLSVKLRDEVETRVHAMGFDVSRNHTRQQHVVSPMPGMVLKILVQAGEEVREGQPTLILEAMKMENILNAPANGTIKTIHVREKQNVDKNQLLIELE